ncbi:helix-turn-helix domain-containing protein [Agromyces salentinus]|uniref:helix-turn-helix domain-containing protein n=1 Tax=Agromyces salentinus TaxID=269421 RepID=UPI0012FACAF4
MSLDIEPTLRRIVREEIASVVDELVRASAPTASPSEPTPSDHPAAWLTVHQAAELAQVSTRTVMRATRAGELHGVQRKPGSMWRVQKHCADAWLANEPCDHRSAKVTQFPRQR